MTKLSGRGLAFSLLITVLFSRNCQADVSCKGLQDCRKVSLEYENCCAGECTRRAYCNGYCVYDSNCDKTKNELCSSDNRCYSADTITPRPAGFCRVSSDCPAKQICDGSANKCVARNPCSNCLSDEVCINEECQKDKSSSVKLSSGAIAGVIVGICAVAIIMAIAVIIYKRTHRSRRPSSPQGVTQHDRALENQQSQGTQGEHPGPDPTSYGNPPQSTAPPYHVTGFTGHQPPPSYEEALSTKNGLTQF